MNNSKLSFLTFVRLSNSVRYCTERKFREWLDETDRGQGLKLTDSLKLLALLSVSQEQINVPWGMSAVWTE